MPNPAKLLNFNQTIDIIKSHGNMLTIKFNFCDGLKKSQPLEELRIFSLSSNV